MTQYTVQLPEDLYKAVSKQADSQQKTPDDLVVEWVSHHVGSSEIDETHQAFEREIAAFERLKSNLMEPYMGQYVAIYQGEVIASGDDKLAVLHEVRQQYGPIVCYVEKVSRELLRTARMPSFRIVNS